MVITYRLGVGRRKSENSFGCVVLQFSSIPCLGSELAVNSPLSMFFPPFISPKTVWFPPPLKILQQNLPFPHHHAPVGDE